ncbi:MAG: ABC transporter ATP-binding protein [Candidatus Dormibacteraeota bacterium]|nr:ABC transporter ATP-binding protein [Candidatus Dormibacteraeota bacterium]
MTLLEVEDLSVRFRTEEGTVQAVDRVSFVVGERETVALVGESGCGKSVTAMALTRLLPANAAVTGQVRFRDRDLLRLPESEVREVRGAEIAYVFQEPATALNPSFTAGFQVAETLRQHRGMARQEAQQRAVELLELVGIPAPERRIGEYPHQLSGGMRQRVMIAMAIACGPRLLIADEPTTALDVTVQAAILDLLRSLRDRLGMTLVLITHDLGVVADAADRVVVMYAGRKVEEAPVHDLFARPRHPYTAGLMAAVPAAVEGRMPERLREIPGMVPSLSDPLPGCAFAPRCPRATDECHLEVPPLRPQGADHLAACLHPLP